MRCEWGCDLNFLKNRRTKELSHPHLVAEFVGLGYVPLLTSCSYEPQTPIPFKE